MCEVPSSIAVLCKFEGFWDAIAVEICIGYYCIRNGLSDYAVSSRLPVMRKEATILFLLDN